MTREANKTQAIREILKSPMDIYSLQEKLENKLQQVIGRAALYTPLSVMQTTGEVRSAGRGRERVYSLGGGK